MKRIFLWVVIAAMLLVGMLPTIAMPVTDLTALAQYMPDKMTIFASMRADDAYFEALDTVLATINDRVPGVLPPFTVEQMLDQALAGNPNVDGSFAETIRPWLGDTVAAAFLMNSGELTPNPDAPSTATETILAAQVTDYEAVVAFFENLATENAEVTFSHEDGYTIARVNNNPGAVYIDPNVLMFTNNAALLPNATAGAILSASADFASSVSALPEADYNAVIYVNLPQMLEDAPATAEDSSVEMFLPLRDAIGSLAIGATILGDRSLTLDIVQPITDPAIFETLGFALPAESTPISFDFARFIPAGTPVVIQSTDLKSLYERGVATLRSAAELQEQAGYEGDVSPTEQLEEGLTQLEFAINTLTRVDLQDDILSWMTANYALTFDFSPVVEDLQPNAQPESFPFEIGFLAEVTDPAAAQAVVDGLAEMLTVLSEDRFTIEPVEIGGVTAQHVEIPVTEDSNTPFPIEFIFGASDEVFVIGTPRAARAALDPTEGLASDPVFVEMQTATLPDTSVLYYVAGEGLTPLAHLATLNGATDADAAALQGVLSLIRSASITSTADASGTSVARLVLTLPATGE